VIFSGIAQEDGGAMREMVPFPGRPVEAVSGIIWLVRGALIPCGPARQDSVTSEQIQEGNMLQEMFAAGERPMMRAAWPAAPLHAQSPACRMHR
jgi:hypothetical protein